MINAVGRDIPEEILEITGKEVFQGNFYKDGKEFTKVGPTIKPVMNNQHSKLVSSIREVLEKCNAHDGMTVSFHHHFREGDLIVCMVMEEIHKMGLKDITICASSLGKAHNALVPMIEDGTITNIESSGVRGKIGEAISTGKLKGLAKHLKNIVYHDSGPYIISSATFPSYFLKDEANIIESHAKLDLAVFQRIAAELGINRRYVGEEPHSQVTGIYNEVMKSELPKSGVECVVVPRKEMGGAVISASTVRQCIQRGDFDALSSLVPQSTLNYLCSKEAEVIVKKICASENVVHY